MSRSRLRLKLDYLDYFRQALTFRWPSGLKATSADANVTVSQPYGFEQKLTGKAKRVDDRGEVVITYPLVDEGRFAPVMSSATDPEGAKRWGMRAYRFQLTLKAGRKIVGSGTLRLDPNDFFGEIGGMKLAQVDSLRQFIECCPERPAFIDTTEMGFTIRTIPDRVKSCSVKVDVMDPKSHKRLAGPLNLKLNGKEKRYSFDGEKWGRGEFWLRVRIYKGSKAVGPYLIRQIFLETPYRPKRPVSPLRVGHSPQYMVDGWIFGSSSGLQHAPDQLEVVSDGPIAEIDRPWEQGPDHLGMNSFTYDKEAGQFRATYYAGPLTEDERLWKMGVRSTITAHSTRYLCLTVSNDGVKWEKPDLGIVEYKGSRKNNILRDKSGEDFLMSGEFDSFPAPVKERPLPRKYRYRFYNPKKDGPVDMDNFVFRVFLNQSMEPANQFKGRFRPKHREFWGFERRGDTFLALTRRPVLTGGRGLHLTHTGERASTYPFAGEPFCLGYPGGGSTALFYHRPSKTFLYYYRPDYPAYPPHGQPYYLWHREAAIRTRAVMWTRDGFHWDRRQQVVPDEHDPPGTTLYGFGFIRPAGKAVSDTDGQLYLGTVLNWDLSTQQNRQHLLWSRDLIHWGKFGANRKPLLENGPIGSWNTASGGLNEYTPVTNGEGEEEWLFTFSAGNCRYMLSTREYASVSLEEFKARRPYYELAPFFTSWEDFYTETKNAWVLTGLAKCKAGRIAHVEPKGSRGEFTTLPLVVEGNRLLVNGQTDLGGSIRVEVQDAEGNPFSELGLDDCYPFSGDRVTHEVRWKRAGLEEVNGRVVRLKVVLEGARLYTFRIAS